MLNVRAQQIRLCNTYLIISQTKLSTYRLTASSVMSFSSIRAVIYTYMNHHDAFYYNYSHARRRNTVFTDMKLACYVHIVFVI